MHRSEQLKVLVHVLVRFATESRLQLTQGRSKFLLICSHKFNHFFFSQNEVKLGNGLHLESHGCFTILVSLHSAKDDMLVLIWTCCTFKSGLKSHARTTPWWPKIDYDPWVILNDLLQLNETGDLEYFAELRLWRRRSSSLACRSSRHTPCSRTRHTWHSCPAIPLSKLLHHLGHLRILTHLLHHGGKVWLATTRSSCTPWHSPHPWHSTLRITTCWSLSKRLIILVDPSNLQWLLLALIIEKLVWTLAQTVLHVHHHGRNLLSKGRVQEILRQIYDIRRNSFSQEQLGNLVSKIVAIVVEYVVILRRELSWNILKHLHKDLFRDFSASKFEYFCRLT